MMAATSGLLLLAAALGQDAESPLPTMAFIECGETNRHIAVHRQDHHYIVHCHLRAQHLQGKRIFARMRVMHEDEAEADQPREVVVTQWVTAESPDDYWSMYLRVPRFEADTSKYIYQLEIGCQKNPELSDLSADRVLDTWSWRMIADQTGQLEASGQVPRIVMWATVSGGEMVIEYHREARCVACAPDVEPINCGMARLDIGRIAGERAARRITEGE